MNARLDKLLNDIMAPNFVYRMAFGLLAGANKMRSYEPGANALRGAPTRLRDATIQLDRLVLAYAADRLEGIAGQLVPANLLAWLRDPSLPEEDQ